MKKNLSFFLLIVFGLLILIYSKGCSNTATIPLKRNTKLEDSIRSYNYDTIKFARSSSKNSIPIVKLYLGFYGKKYFIIDTGATVSIIDSGWINDHQDLIEYIRKTDFMRLQSFSEKTSSNISYIMGLPINGILHEFVMLDIQSLRESCRLSGYDIIGILGSDFLSKNKYIIDYNKRCLYRSSTSVNN